MMQGTIAPAEVRRVVPDSGELVKITAPSVLTIAQSHFNYPPRQGGYTPSKHFPRREMGYTVEDSSTFRRCRIRSRIMSAIAVQYFDERGGFWRVGHLEKADLKWAWVRPMVGRTVRIPVAQTREVEQAKKSAS